MASYLYRLGRASFVRRRLVAAIWLAVLIASLVAAVTLSGQTSTSFSIPGTESQVALDQLDERFPQMSASGARANVVFRAPDEETFLDPDNQAAVKAVMAGIEELPLVAVATDPLTFGGFSADGTTAISRVTFAISSVGLTEQDREELLTALEIGREAGLAVEAGGDWLLSVPEQSAAELIGFALAAVVLFLTLGSLIAAGLPLLTAVIGLGVGISLITAASGFVELGSTTTILAMMIGLAVSIDYALFIVTRYRSEYADHADVDLAEAAGRAVGTAGSAVVFAGLTVIIALVGLMVVNIPMLTEMGLAAALTVTISVLVAVTLLPALLGFAGARVMGKGTDREADHDEEVKHERGWLRYGSRLARRPWPVLLVSTVGLALLAIPFFSIEMGLPGDGTAAEDSTQRQAYDMVAEAFGPGYNGPLLVLVDAADTSEPAAAIQAAGDALRSMDEVALVAPPILDEAGTTAMLNVIPVSGPSTTETTQLVHDIREDAAVAAAAGGPVVAVTGTTALTIDVSQKLDDALVPYLLVVVGLALVLLLLVFRSILVPLIATLGFVLTIGATLGVVVIVFQWGWLPDFLGIVPGPIISMMPIFLIGVVFGLAMDYQYFLVTRMREEHVHGASAMNAVVKGFGHGARVVTAAAAIMIGVFAGFGASDDQMIRTIAVGFSVAVFFDAFIVRMHIVPTAMVLLGDRAWWLPSWLDRILPNVDIEGAKLEHRLEASSPPETTEG